jgi:AAA ATPase domain
MTGQPGDGSARPEAPAGAGSLVARVVPDVLVGRRADCLALDDLVGAVRGGLSRSLVIAGEAGIGKTSLLRYAAQAAAGVRTVSIARGGIGAAARLRRAAPDAGAIPGPDRS